MSKSTEDLIAELNDLEQQGRELSARIARTKAAIAEAVGNRRIGKARVLRVFVVPGQDLCAQEVCDRLGVPADGPHMATVRGALKKLFNDGSLERSMRGFYCRE